MIKIHITEPDSDEWRDWRSRCLLATTKLCQDVANGEEVVINEVLYREMRQWYYSSDGPFHGKCAYCESPIAETQGGQLDHFRPKKWVTDLREQRVFIKAADGAETPHPGYYWLAYDWRNLLPTCVGCNTINAWQTPGKRIGKGSRFPLKGTYADAPGLETDEHPLLLNPTEAIEPSVHFEIDDLGIVIPKTEYGDACDAVFGLNERGPLRDGRQNAFRQGFNIVLSLLDAARAADKERLEDCSQTLNSFKLGIAPYSAAGLAGIAKARPKAQKVMHNMSKVSAALGIESQSKDDVHEPDV